jgi:hypothetical protein
MVWEQDFYQVNIFQDIDSMNKKLAAKHIGFADSEYKSFHMSEDATLTIYLKSWDAKTLRIVFTHAIQFFYTLGNEPSDLFEIENSPEVDKMLIERYGRIPPDNSLKLFVLEDIDDFAFIQVVAESVDVFKE